MKQELNILGPCAAETEEQLLRIAQSLSAKRSELCQQSGLCSNLIFRAGIWKPRTSPETFQGVGDAGLKWLRRVKEEYCMCVATEVSTPEQVRKALEAGIDYLWLGARTSANPILVQAIADEIAKGSPKGVLIKNPVNEDAALWIGNIKRLMACHQHPVYAVHRGCDHKPCWAMAYRLRKEQPDVPLLLDPSHMSGDAAKVAELCAIADELEYDGLMVEVHDKPAEALSDARQQITPEEWINIVERRKTAALKVESPIELRWLRRMMDEVDDALWDTIARRMEVSRQIGAYKRANGMKVVQPTRFEQILTKRLEWAHEQELNETTIRTIMNALHDESVRIQEQ